MVTNKLYRYVISTRSFAKVAMNALILTVQYLLNALVHDNSNSMRCDVVHSTRSAVVSFERHTLLNCSITLKLHRSPEILEVKPTSMKY